jgi:hypothetical protein
MNTIETVKELLEGGWVVNGTTCVPSDPSNHNARAVLEWLSKPGNVATPADPPAPPPTPRGAITQRLRDDPALRAIVAGVMADKGWTKAQMLAWLVSKEQETF